MCAIRFACHSSKPSRERERKREKWHRRLTASIIFHWVRLVSSALYILSCTNKQNKHKKKQKNHRRVPNRCEYLPTNEILRADDIEFQMKASDYRHLTWKCNKHQTKCKLRNNSHQRTFCRFICIKNKWYSLVDGKVNIRTRIRSKFKRQCKREKWISCQIWFLIIWLKCCKSLYTRLMAMWLSLSVSALSQLKQSSRVLLIIYRAFKDKIIWKNK